MKSEDLFIKADKLYDEGMMKEAFELFLQAAKKGNVDCMSRLGSMYSCGEGVTLNYDKAIEWELKAIEGGSECSMVNLGITYRMRGDIKNAKVWFEKALESGDGSAALELAKLYMVSDKERDKVISYLKQAISNDNMCEADIEEAESLLAESPNPQQAE